MRRSKVDWVLEGVALAAVLAALALVAVYWPQIPERVMEARYRLGRAPGMAGILSAKTTLWVIALIDVAAYLGLTLGARGNGLFQIPPQVDRDSPQLRQMLFSMVIVMKAVLALFAAYLVWALVNLGMGRGGGLSRTFLTVFTLAVPVPLVFYTLRMRRYRR